MEQAEMELEHKAQAQDTALSNSRLRDVQKRFENIYNIRGPYYRLTEKEKLHEKTNRLTSKEAAHERRTAVS